MASARRRWCATSPRSPKGAESVIFFPQAAGGAARADLRAEERALELLRDAAGDGAREMYERLGFLRFEPDGAEHGYLIYPQRPLVGYDARSGELLSEYCVRFREDGERLPDADDVLAKWMALAADEREVIGTSNVHPLGRQVDPEMAQRDLRALRRWEETA